MNGRRLRISLMMVALLGAPACAKETTPATPPPAVRPPGATMVVQFDDLQTADMPVAGLPYVNDEGPILVPGEVMTVQFAPGDTLGVPRLVSVGHAGGGELDFPSDAGPGTMMLSYTREPGQTYAVVRMRHNFPRAVAYDVNVERFREGQWAADMTISCPVKVDTEQVKRWPGPVRQIFFHDFRFAADRTGEPGCE